MLPFFSSWITLTKNAFFFQWGENREGRGNGVRNGGRWQKRSTWKREVKGETGECIKKSERDKKRRNRPGS